MFLALETQWRWGPIGRVGIDYGAVEPTARMAGIEMTAGLFGDLKLMEAAALKVMNGRMKK